MDRIGYRRFAGKSGKELRDALIIGRKARGVAERSQSFPYWEPIIITKENRVKSRVKVFSNFIFFFAAPVVFYRSVFFVFFIFTLGITNVNEPSHVTRSCSWSVSKALFGRLFYSSILTNINSLLPYFYFRKEKKKLLASADLNMAGSLFTKKKKNAAFLFIFDISSPPALGCGRMLLCAAFQ